MEELIEQYNNQVFSITLFGIDYNAIFRKIDNSLGFEIETNDAIELRTIWRKNSLKIINGKYQGRPIVLINSYTRKTQENKITLKIDIMLDGFLIGKDINNKKISKFVCSYHGINEFDLSRYYDFSTKDVSVKARCECDKFSCTDGNLLFHKTNKMSLGWNNFSFNKVNKFEYYYNKKVSIFTAIKHIWHLKNLLSIFSKKRIAVKNIELYSDKDTKAILFMNHVKTPSYKFENEFIEHEENSFLITYDDIKNDFGNILESSKKCFEKIEPVISMYLDSLEKEMPTLNRFLAFCQMLECFSREYDDANAHLLMITKEPKKTKKDTELKYRLNSLIKRVNYIYNFRTTKMFALSEKITKGRNYYIHHDASKKKDELSHDQLFMYSYFLEDILLANIYRELGIDKKVIKKAFDNPFYYFSCKL